MEKAPHELVERSEPFYVSQVRQKLSAIEGLRAYSRGETAEIPNMPEIATETIDRLGSEEGMAVLRTWLRAFKGTLGVARDFMKDIDSGYGTPKDAAGISQVLDDIIESLNSII